MNFIDIGLAFLEGVALIISPCILPVLPLMLAGTVEKGRARPYGITLGFVLAFSAFVLLSRQLVVALNIMPDMLRYGSLALLFALGVVMLSEKLSTRFSALTQGLVSIGSGKMQPKGDGFPAGLITGILIGFVWTPCAGPILAAVLVGVIRQQTDVQGFLVTFAFAIGAALPMLALTLAGKALLKQSRGIARHAQKIRKGFAVLILLSVGVMAYGVDFSAITIGKTTAQQPPAMALQDGLPQPYDAPEFDGIQTWLNSAPLTMASLKGKVVLVDFWTYSCINCVRTLPYITAWDAAYRDQGLVIIGVHAPEFEFEKNVDNIRTAMEKYGIHYPVAVDNRLATWQKFNNHYWPAHYLIDRNGRVVYAHHGEGHYDVTENNIRYLLGLGEASASNAILPPRLIDETPETYLGYARADRFSALGQMQKDAVAGYLPAGILQPDHWSLNGRWRIEAQKITAVDRGAFLRLNFKAKKVYLVMAAPAGETEATVSLKLNGAPVSPDIAGKDVSRSRVSLSSPTLYELVSQPTPENGLLEIAADRPGIEFYSFTFGE